MKRINSYILLLVCGMLAFTSCDTDRDMNPVVTAPTQFVLNTPAVAANNTIDLNNTSSLFVTCSQPDYGFPVVTNYTLQAGTKSDMSDAVDIATSTDATFSVDGESLAASLTTLFLNAGKSESDFPMTVPVYMRAKAAMDLPTDSLVEVTSITSNTITLPKVKLLYSLPAVEVPDEIYLVGSFCSWTWGNSVTMVPVYTDGTTKPYRFWHMVWIDGEGVKFNTSKAWDGGEVGFEQLTSVGGDKASEIITSGGNIASSSPSWYMMVLTATVEGRDIKYAAEFYEPAIYFIGLINDIGWNEGVEAGKFTIPTTKDGEFVSPTITTTLAGNDSDGCVRIYATLDAGNWWHSEFIPVNGKISYRGAGGDQDRINCAAGQKVYLNFNDDTGSIE